MLPVFAKPGKHTYLVKMKNTQDRLQSKLLYKKKWLEQARDGTLDMERRRNRKRKWDQHAYQRVVEKLKPELFVYKCQVQPRKEPIPLCKPHSFNLFSFKVD